MVFISPTKGKLTIEQVFLDIMDFMTQNPEATFKLIVGSDSQLREEVCYVTAVIILREGKGGRFYYYKEHEQAKITLKQRIFYETSRSLNIAARLAEMLAENGCPELNIEIHLDIGEVGKTKEIIREVVGMVTGSGFGAKIKPNSYGAFKVADKFTK